MDILFSDADNPEAEQAAKVAAFPLIQMLSDRGIAIGNLGVISKHLMDICRDTVCVLLDESDLQDFPLLEIAPSLSTFVCI